MSRKGGIWRDPPEESSNIYPGLVLADDRCAGSITAGRSRLPLWAFAYWVAVQGWAADPNRVNEVAGYDPDQYGWTKERMGEFLHCLFEQRGEFGRLILMLADVERRDTRGMGRDDRAWYQVPSQRKRVMRQLRRCLDALETEGRGRE